MFEVSYVAGQTYDIRDHKVPSGCSPFPIERAMFLRSYEDQGKISNVFRHSVIIYKESIIMSIVQSEYRIVKGNRNLIVAFGGMALQFGMIPPFEFLKYLSSNYENCDLVFYIDVDQCWYHKGIRSVTSNIEETVKYLGDLINPYDDVTFIGTSAGGYAAILFGSLCNVNNVVAFIPQTLLTNPIEARFSDLTRVVNNKSKYHLYGDASIRDINHDHHIRHCDNLIGFDNVVVNRLNGCDMRVLRNDGTLKKILDNVVFQTKS